MRAAPPFTNDPGIPYPSSSDEDEEASSWSVHAGSRDASFKQSSPTTPMMQEKSFLTPNTVARHLAGLELASTSGALELASTSDVKVKIVGEQRKKKALAGLTKLAGM